MTQQPRPGVYFLESWGGGIPRLYGPEKLQEEPGQEEEEPEVKGVEGEAELALPLNGVNITIVNKPGGTAVLII